MASNEAVVPSDQSELLKQILVTVQSIQQNYEQLTIAVYQIQREVNVLSGAKQVRDAAVEQSPVNHDETPARASDSLDSHVSGISSALAKYSDPSEQSQSEVVQESAPDREGYTHRSESRPPTTSRIILTTYPSQSGIDPLVMNWGHRDPLQRGPVVVSRNQSTIRRRNGT